MITPIASASALIREYEFKEPIHEFTKNKKDELENGNSVT